MLTKLGIKGRVLLLTILPASLMAAMLGGYFTWMQLSELQSQLLQRGEMIAQDLAPLAANALGRKDKVLLSRIATQTLEQTDVRAVSFLDVDRTPLAHAGPTMISPSPIGSGSQLLNSTGTDATRYLLPVFGNQRHLTSPIIPAEADTLLGWVELEISHNGTLLRGYRSLFASLLLILTGLACTATLAVRMSRTINGPMSQIKQAVSQLKDGNLETRLPPLGSRELDELASGINRMAATLQNAQEELQLSIDQATEDVRQNLETIEIQNIELDLARKEALEASRIKSEFLANMSHEIRTPLNGILGFTHLLQKSELTPRQFDYLGTIEKSADNLLSIINEILDFSKIEAGKLVLDNIPFNLRDLLQDTLTILAPAAHAKQLELVSLVYRDTPLALSGDPLRLRQILTNLVSNAIKFTREGTIVARAMLEDETEEHAQLRISVQDTGIGLSSQDVRALFQAFSQADNSLSRQPGGTGLGLVISKRLIEQMGGEIGVDSTPGEGSEFWISLKLPKAREDKEESFNIPLVGLRAAVLEHHDLARQALEHQLEDCGLQTIVFNNLENLLNGVTAAHETPLAIDLAVLGVTALEISPERLRQHIWDLENLNCKVMVLCPTTEHALFQLAVHDVYTQLQAKPACTRKLQKALSELIAPRVLCVDDNPANLLLVQTLLEDMGAEVVAVEGGYAAVNAVQQEAFDLVLMDVQMPGMDGRQATEAIRAWEAERNQSSLPIVALTAHAMANEKRSLLQSGMDDYLTKPISERQLAQVVLKWTGLALRNPAPERQNEAPEGHVGPLVLDHEEGLRLAAGKADLAADMLAMLLASLAADREAIRVARANQDIQALIERIHRLHGATRYCGVPQLRTACQRAETLLKQNAAHTEAALDDLDKAIIRLESEARVTA
ncbi:Response regulator, sensor histidine kinase component GacS [Pseudomonas amygdali pv. myricae]|uniref:response regulator n=1 Tax=Pseudomonas amygdali TaxID=47877 RepID=UPI0006B8EB55|nr:response regulator [Pseudomonas amygdali]KPB67148.1 Response regulator [Pseudomonas amygdali pv. myricae]KPX88446.1 Response regulator, sensor histidine kinase component GacS [Pseudomonas amygdali pv. myricae]KWS45304.1 hybrid sensor histidine kinase/response regulator [Pseudomonas amygdali pv. myricae]RMT52232.1 Response regulator, sensor histidine kinase component GacS [Pseudomonas amygdali pv. myricae]RMU99040.1 Response regulator, sensor histidine kinase component GacS [Pseudomonas amyg